MTEIKFNNSSYQVEGIGFLYGTTDTRLCSRLHDVTLQYKRSIHLMGVWNNNWRSFYDFCLNSFNIVKNIGI